MADKKEKTDFIENLRLYGMKDLIPLLTDYQDKIVEAVSNRGGKGTLTLKIDYKLDGDNRIEVSCNADYKIPKKKLLSMSMFRTRNHKLAPHDPDQYTIDDIESSVDDFEPLAETQKQPLKMVTSNV